MNNRSKGIEGEEIAKKHLIDQGYSVLEHSFRCKAGEIDLIAKKGGEIYFIEVKTRWSENFGNPLEAITPFKQKRIIRAAKLYLAKNRVDACCHLSAIGVDMSKGEPKVEFIEDAFEIF